MPWLDVFIYLFINILIFNLFDTSCVTFRKISLIHV
jgi:hypothetical protein